MHDDQPISQTLEGGKWVPIRVSVGLKLLDTYATWTPDPSIGDWIIDSRSWTGL
jgi:hypothetical protein